jgi:hypothetical protein
VTTITDIVRRHADVTEPDVEWLRTLVGDWQLVSDLCFADLVLWVRDRSGGWSAVAHARPSTWATVYYDDVVGTVARPGWRSGWTPWRAAAPTRWTRRPPRTRPRRTRSTSSGRWTCSPSAVATGAA